jgi:hypothetical protein
MTTKAFTLVVLVGFLACVSGNEMSFSLLYLAPITLVTWFVGRRGGVAVASLSVLVGFGADMLSGHRFAHPLIPWWNTLMRVSFFLIVVTLLARLKRTYEGQTHMARELQASLTTVNILRRFIPICAWCKKVRDDQGYWQQMEMDMTEHSTASLTYGICQECYDKELQALR